MRNPNKLYIFNEIYVLISIKSVYMYLWLVNNKTI